MFKATGTSTPSLAFGLCIEAVLLSLCAALVAVILARLIAPSFPFPVEITAGATAKLLVVAAVVGVLASAAGVRSTAKVDPAAAFGDA